MDLLKMKEIAYRELGEKSSHSWKEKGNKYHHGLRVAKLALELRRRIFPADDGHDEILTAAAWFHDLCNGEEEHAKRGALKTRSLLHGLCTEDELEEICGIIAVHDDRHPEGSPYSRYVQLQQDADHLDHFGTYDIWTVVLYTVERGETILDAVEWLRKTRHEAHEAYAGYRPELNFSLSKRIYDEKCDFENLFAERFAKECDGEIVGLDRLLEESYV